MPRLALLLALVVSFFLPPPRFRPLPAVTTASLRGLSVVDARIAWASGTHGTYLRTTDGGAHWSAGQVPKAEGLDFRDIKAFDAETAYLLGIAAGGGIFKTSDGGGHWREQYSSPAPGFFLDCLAFWDREHGLALGDPMGTAGGKTFLLLRTDDGGQTWAQAERMPPALAGEGAFAASGTTLVAGADGNAWFGTGGPSGARVFHSSDRGRTWTAVATPLSGAAAGAGIYSLAFDGVKRGVAVGGDYTHPLDTARTVAWTEDGGRSWQLQTGAPPGGYRSAVAYVPGSQGRELIAVGPSGADFSGDGGRHWVPVSASAQNDGFNSIAFPSQPGAGWAVGGHGKMARVEP